VYYNDSVAPVQKAPKIDPLIRRWEIRAAACIPDVEVNPLASNKYSPRLYLSHGEYVKVLLHLADKAVHRSRRSITHGRKLRRKEQDRTSMNSLLKELSLTPGFSRQVYLRGIEF